MHNFIIVGTGDYYSKIVGKSLKKLAEKGRLKLSYAVDILPQIPAGHLLSDVPYLRRQPSQKLSQLLAQANKADNTVVLLGHVNELHTADATDLVENDFSVLLEKPYCLNRQQWDDLNKIITEKPDKVILLEYYLMMKSAPLLWLAGKIKKESFFTHEHGILQTHSGLEELFAGDLENMHGRLAELLGRPERVEIELLEGKGGVGRLDHRGPHLIDRQRGGGMILDLALHAIAPVFALEDYLGVITTAQEVKTASCQEYMEMAQEKYGIEQEKIGESYAQIKLRTSQDIPLEMRIGKYVLPNENRRHITIYGDRGRIRMDLSDCRLAYTDQQENTYDILTIPKEAESKYYPVLSSALSMVEQDSVYNFNSNRVALDAQAFVLALTETKDRGTVYQAGAQPEEIF